MTKKAYWICFYQNVLDQDALAAYAKLAAPAIKAGGGRTLARGLPSATFENGTKSRATLIEFDSIELALAAHDSAAYQEALSLLGDAAQRDIRVVEALE